MKWLIRKVKNMFRSTTPVANDYGNGEEITYSWGYINPHTKIAAGAVGYRDGKTYGEKFSEYQYGLEVAEINRVYIPFATRDEGGVTGAAIKLKKVGVNASIEAHLNAYNKQVKGAEILVQAGDSASYEAAEKLLAAFALSFPKNTIRGVKVRNRGDRGWYGLEMARLAGMKVRLLSEFFFIDSEYIEPKAMADFLRNNLTKL